MSGDTRSVYDRLESQEEKIDSILKILSNSEKSQNPLPKYQVDIRASFIRRVKASKKEYLWLGTVANFIKEKRKILVVQKWLIIVGVISTIVSSIAFGLYSTFTLFENIWLITSIFIMININNCFKKMIDYDLIKRSCYRHKQDVNGIWHNSCKEKLRYSLIRRLSYIAIICNIYSIWLSSSGLTAICATLLELLFFLLSIYSSMLYKDFLLMFTNFVKITGKIIGNDVETYVFDLIKREVFSIDEFNEKYGKIMN